MRLFILIFILTVTFACTLPNSSFINSANSDLAIGKDIKSTLALHGADTFEIDLKANVFIAGSANQISADVVITLFDPDKKEVARFDESGRGPDLFYFDIWKAGVHKMVITPFKEEKGEYVLQLKKAEVLAHEPDKRIEQLMSVIIPGDGPGASVAVSRDGKIIYSKGFGHADLEHDAHNAPNTVFHIASVSKQFTAFAIAMLVDQGKISLDDDIREYLPEMHDFGTPITIRHLIHHTSGLRDQWNLLAMAGWRLDDVITREQILRVIGRQRELNFKPGDQHNYCNTGYTLMAEIVSRVTKKSFPQWTKENIFDPLKMGATQFYDDHQKVVPNRAYSYYQADTIFKKSVLSYANVGATSLFTTVEDISKWADNFYTKTVGNDNVMKMMEQPFILNNGDTVDYAFGQAPGKYKGQKTWSHNGADAGYRSQLLRFPDQRVSISVFSNLAGFNPGMVSYILADQFLKDVLKEDPKKEEPPQQQNNNPEVPFDPKQVKLTEYTGKFYSSELETFYELELKNDTLIAHHSRHDDFRLTPTKTDGFRSDVWWMGDIEFIRDAAKRVTGMKASNGRVVNLKFVKQ
jgi:CubicO group peptidase (beta-lactamase class C family)